MNNLTRCFNIIVIFVMLGCLCSGMTLERKFRAKRQAADVKTAEYLARWALERPPEGCEQIGCGLVDLVVSGKKKKSGAESHGRYQNILPSRILSVLINSEKEE